MKPDLKPASAVFDNGRRGNPLLGCDCVVCFGYCMIDADEAVRAKLQTADKRSHDETDRLE